MPPKVLADGFGSWLAATVPEMFENEGCAADITPDVETDVRN